MRLIVPNLMKAAALINKKSPGQSKIERSIALFQGVHELMTLSPNELNEWCQDATLRKQFIHQIKDIRTLIKFIHETPTDKLNVILAGCGQGLAKKLIRSSEDFTALLIAVNEEKTAVLLQHMKDNLITLIKKSIDFNAVLKPLTQEQRTAIYNLRSDWLVLIKSGSDLHEVLEVLSPDQRSVVYNKVKEKLPTLIKYSGEFNKVFKLLSVEEGNNLYKAMNDCWLILIGNYHNLQEVCEVLSPTECAAVYKAITARWPQMIRNVYELGKICKVLSPVQIGEVLKIIEEYWSNITKESRGFFEHPSAKLSPEHRAAVYVTMKNHLWKEFIKTSSYFKDLLELFSDDPVMVNTLWHDMKNHVPTLIKDTKDFTTLFKLLPLDEGINFYSQIEEELSAIFRRKSPLIFGELTPEQCAALCCATKSEAMKDEFLSSILDDASDNDEKPLSYEHFSAVCNATRDSLPKMFGNGYTEFRIKELPPEKKLVIYKIVKENPQEMLPNPRCFDDFLQHFSSEQGLAIYTLMKDRWAEFIKNAEDFYYALKSLSVDQRTTVYMAKKDDLNLYINNAKDFANILAHLSLEQRTIVYEAKKNYLNSYIKNANDFLSILFHLTPEQRTAVYLEKKDDIKSYIGSSKDLLDVLYTLLPEQCTEVCTAIKDRMPELFTERHMFRHFPLDPLIAVFKANKEMPALLFTEDGNLYSKLSLNECTAFCWSIKNDISVFITEAQDFSMLIEKLSIEQCTIFCTTLQVPLSKILKDSIDFNTLLKSLSNEQCSLICTVMNEQLISCVKDNYDLEDLLEGLAPELQTLVSNAMKPHLTEIVKGDEDINLEEKSQCVEQSPVVTLTQDNAPNEGSETPVNTHAQRKKEQELSFAELMNEIKEKALKIELGTYAREAAEQLIKNLEHASQFYFKESSKDYPWFKNSCQQAINDAAELNHYFGWSDLFAELLLTILSVGLVPLANKIVTGSWTFRLFKSKDELVVDEVLEQVNDKCLK